MKTELDYDRGFQTGAAVFYNMFIKNAVLHVEGQDDTKLTYLKITLGQLNKIKELIIEN